MPERPHDTTTVLNAVQAQAAELYPLPNGRQRGDGTVEGIAQTAYENGARAVIAALQAAGLLLAQPVPTDDPACANGLTLRTVTR